MLSMYSLDQINTSIKRLVMQELANDTSWHYQFSQQLHPCTP